MEINVLEGSPDWFIVDGSMSAMRYLLSSACDKIPELLSPFQGCIYSLLPSKHVLKIGLCLLGSLDIMKSFIQLEPKHGKYVQNMYIDRHMGAN